MCLINFNCYKVLKNGFIVDEKLINGENKGFNKNEDVLIKVSVLNYIIVRVRWLKKDVINFGWDL